ncbi:hypothetical protein [Undibacterium luofuense]|uniref:Uncharacterized protein n=1 Tax=Undibacterium luofuense TaxID=2828733 RepID=A0A941I641_9BURK|nr:hypothetical protein [Undibacterium luofuense]MBR7780533.1 hypothetical protein [Undibacterium luofuense]
MTYVSFRFPSQKRQTLRWQTNHRRDAGDGVALLSEMLNRNQFASDRTAKLLQRHKADKRLQQTGEYGLMLHSLIFVIKFFPPASAHARLPHNLSLPRRKNPSLRMLSVCRDIRFAFPHCRIEIKIHLSACFLNIAETDVLEDNQIYVI